MLANGDQIRAWSVLFTEQSVNFVWQKMLGLTKKSTFKPYAIWSKQNTRASKSQQLNLHYKFRQQAVKNGNGY